MIVNIDQGARDLDREVCSTTPVLWIMAVILTFNIMKKCEQFNHLAINIASLGQEQAIQSYPCPVRHTVYAMPVELKSLPGKINQFGCDNF